MVVSMNINLMFMVVSIQVKQFMIVDNGPIMYGKNIRNRYNYLHGIYSFTKRLKTMCVCRYVIKKKQFKMVRTKQDEDVWK